jgi:mRNA interferase YafQ
MQKYNIKTTNQYRKSFRSLKHSGVFDQKKLDQVIDCLSEGLALPSKNRDHKLKGKWSGYRECHVQPDFLLIYKKEKDLLILVLVNIGSHAELF